MIVLFIIKLKYQSIFLCKQRLKLKSFIQSPETLPVTNPTFHILSYHTVGYTSCTKFVFVIIGKVELDMVFLIG